MQLRDCLARAGEEQLGRMAATAGLQPAWERGALEEGLADALTDPARLTSLLADLSDEEWAALKVVFFNGGDHGITVELCHQIVNLLSGRRRKSSARAVEELQDRGLIFARSQNYRQVFFIPTDLMALLEDILHLHMVHRVCLAADQPVEQVPQERDLLEDLHRFLAYVYRNEITLTQQGQIFKRHLRALYELLLTGEKDDENLAGRYPEPLGTLVGYALDRHLIARADGLLRPTDQLTEWVKQPDGFKQLDLFHYWQDRFFYQDLQIFLSVMRTVKEAWVSLGQLVAEAEPLINPSQRGSLLTRLRHHLETFLAPMGLIEMGSASVAAGQVPVCRLTADGAAVLQGGSPAPHSEPAHRHLLLQATFEVIAARPVPSEVLWLLELTAELIKRTDRTLTYRFSRQSIYRALKLGMEGREILAFLQQESATGVPQNVAFDLSAWVESFGQVYLQAVTLLRCSTPQLAQQIKASRRTGPYVLGELTPVDLIVDGSQRRELLEALEADGLMPRPDMEEAD